MHVCEARHQVLAATIDLQCRGGHFDLIGWTDLRNAPINHDHRLPCQNSFAVKGNDVNVDESDDLRLLCALRSLGRTERDVEYGRPQREQGQKQRQVLFGGAGRLLWE